MQIALRQFEQIDGLFQSCLRRPDLEQVMTHPYATADYIRTVYFRPEWMLFDACVEAIGLDAANEFPCAVDCAADILTKALLCRIEVVDTEAA